MASLNVDLCRLQYCFTNYLKVLEAKADTLKDKGNILIELDDWYQNDLPTTINQRRTRYINHEELCKLMKWKLTRGKFRPRLAELVKSNDAKMVESVSRKAFQQLPDVVTAMKTLTTLKAVGPATASAILAAVLPEKVPFMADESMLMVLPDRLKAYTIPYFIDYMNAVNSIGKILEKSDSKSSSIQRKWPAHQVELALWSSSVALSLHLHMDVCGDSDNNKDTFIQDCSPKKKKKKILTL